MARETATSVGLAEHQAAFFLCSRGKGYTPVYCLPRRTPSRHGMDARAYGLI